MTDEISRSIGEITERSRRIGDNVAGLTSTAGSNKAGADSARQAAQQLAGMARDLETVVSTFRY